MDFWAWGWVTDLGSLGQVHHGVRFEVVLVLPAEHGGDDDDDDGDHSNGSQHGRDDPQVVWGVLHHSCRKRQTNMGQLLWARSLLLLAFSCLHVEISIKAL